MKQYDVAVVGLGPTGLTLAHLLGRRGLSVLVLEREPEFYGTARAVYTDDEAMRVFQTAGVADEIHEDMNVDSVVQWVRADGGVLVQFRTFDRPLGWPVTNFLYQPYLETRLEALLDRYPHVEVRRGRKLLDFSQDAHGVTITHAPASGTDYGRRESAVDHDNPETARASYLIGADGGRSAVRLELGIEMSARATRSGGWSSTSRPRRASTPSGTCPTSTSCATRTGPRSAVPSPEATTASSSHSPTPTRPRTSRPTTPCSG